MVTHPLAIAIEPSKLFNAIARLPGAFFLDTGQPGRDNQFSFMGFQPRMQLRVAANGAASLNGRPVSNPAAPLDLIETFLEPPADTSRECEIPFASGLVLALAYEAKNWIEKLPDPPAQMPPEPWLVASLYDSVIAYSHQAKSFRLASWHLSSSALRAQAQEIEAIVHRHTPPTPLNPRSLELTANMSKAEYLDKVDRIQSYIASGDVYQVNISQRFTAGTSVSPTQVYQRLRQVQPVPFGFYADFGEFRIVGNSPERFLRRRGTILITCPIKGTMERRTVVDDASAIRELCKDPKEAAEHVMIVDVERNDLGRICKAGSVHVSSFAQPILLSTLYHLESTVAGQLRAGASIADVLRATFPSGSITGAPKIRAMEIIAELEPQPRGFYTGTVGYIDHSGDFDLAMAIRTATIGRESVVYSAGGGIVADSIPEREYQECLVKAKAFFTSLGCSPPSEKLRKLRHGIRHNP